MLLNCFTSLDAWHRASRVFKTLLKMCMKTLTSCIFCSTLSVRRHVWSMMPTRKGSKRLRRQQNVGRYACPRKTCFTECTGIPKKCTAFLYVTSMVLHVESYDLHQKVDRLIEIYWHHNWMLSPVHRNLHGRWTKRLHFFHVLHCSALDFLGFSGPRYCEIAPIYDLRLACYIAQQIPIPTKWRSRSPSHLLYDASGFCMAF